MGCGKTAYPLESYSAADNTFHKLCFRCKECNVTLNVGSFKAFEGSVYCAKCVPKPSATAVADDFKVKSATSAPKKTAEGLGAVQKGTGDKAVGVGLDSMSVKSATSAPKVTAEGVPISARNASVAAGNQTDVAGATYDDEEAVEEEQYQGGEEEYQEGGEEEYQEGGEEYDEGAEYDDE